MIVQVLPPGEVMKNQDENSHSIKPRPVGPVDKRVKAAIAGDAPYVPSGEVERLAWQLAEKLAGAETAGNSGDSPPED